MVKILEKEITKLVSEIIEIPEAEIKPEANFTTDLNVDSMKAIEIVAAMEKKFKIIIPEKEIPKIHQLNQVIALVKNLIKT